MSSKEKLWYKDGIQFSCQGSGKCCISRGEYGFVYLTKTDRKNMAKYLNLTISEFVKKYCSNQDGVFHLKETKEQPNCIFLNENKCSVYAARPTQCRTWPFWPEVMSPKAWKKEVVKFCPGAGKGKIIPYEKIKQQLYLQIKSEIDIENESIL